MASIEKSYDINRDVFLSNWQPMADRVIIERLDLELKFSPILITDADKSLKGRVLAVGPGKRVGGDWWHVGGEWIVGQDGLHYKVGGDWEWIPTYAEPMKVKVGDLVYFNSKWHDLGSDYQHHAWWDNPSMHLVQQGDILGIVNV